VVTLCRLIATRLGSLGRGLCRVELGHELVGPGLDARLELAP